MSIKVFRCTHCGTTLFPARYLCPSCGGAEWSALDAEGGTVTAATAVRRRVGADNGGDIHLASVATDAGPIVIARLDSPVETGDAVSLALDAQHRIVARRR
ncbi:Zn-ribbon domain-containing OB-fold protein [Paraburkholderia sp. GAS32]|uniref:Zn-ribbon domain-containing OB-fold protein n=1 Tax=Paraburkholderia sp. GAS32 TaxID=3035129 RepID=UPI003D1A4FF7